MSRRACTEIRTVSTPAAQDHTSLQSYSDRYATPRTGIHNTTTSFYGILELLVRFNDVAELLQELRH